MTKYFISADGDGHWYLVQAKNRDLWEAWQDIPEDDERGWEPPAFASRIDYPEAVEFYLPAEVDSHEQEKPWTRLR